MIFSILWKLNQNFYQMMLYFMMGLSLISLLSFVFKLLVDKKYEYNNYLLIYISSYAVIAVLSHYILKYIGKYDTLTWMYWLLPFILIIVSTILCCILYKKDKEKNDSDKRPKIISNIK